MYRSLIIELVQIAPFHNSLPVLVLVLALVLALALARSALSRKLHIR